MRTEDAYQIFCSGLTQHFSEREIGQLWRMLLEDYLRPKLGTINSTRINSITSELIAGKPIQHITGIQFFYNHPFRVNEHVLIPRPETEELVEWVLTECDDKPKRVLDIGTGSGCIAISLKAERPNWEVDAIDISEAALEVASQNAMDTGVKINFWKEDILPLDLDSYKAYDLIVSNPPYISQNEAKSLDKNVLLFEPHKALIVDDSDPLLFYKRIVHLSQGGLLKRSGNVFMECSEFFCQTLFDHLKLVCPGANIEKRQDLQGKDRMIRVFSL